MSSLAFAPANTTRGAQSFVVFSSTRRRRVKRSGNAAAVFRRDGLCFFESTSSRRRSTKTKASSSESSSEMRLSAAERKQLEEQRKLFEAELARRERAKQRKSDEPDYKAMFREEEKKLNESLMSGESESVNEADVEFRRRQLMLMKVEKELKPMARGYGVSPSGTKAKLVEKILEHEMKTLAMTSDFNEQDVVDGASSWRKARSVDEKVAKEKEGENWAQTERSRMLKDTYGFGRGNIDDDDDDDDDDEEDTWSRGEDDEENDGFTSYSDNRFGREVDDSIYEIESENPHLVLSKDVKKRATEQDLERRYAMINGLREVAKSKVGLERDSTLILSAIASSIEEFYKKNARRSAFTTLDRARKGLLFGRGIDVVADIDVDKGNFRLLVRVLGRNGTIEREYDDAAFFDKWIRSGGRRRITDLGKMLNEHMKREVSYKATEYYDEYMIGEVVTGTARMRGYDDEWLLDLPNGATATLPASEQIPGSASDFVQGDEVVVLVLGVDDNQYAAGQRAPVLVSSAVAGVVAGVITAQVPELRDGKLQIVNIARIPGKSTKIIVKSNDPGVNVKDACLGVNFERIERVKQLICSGDELIQIIDFKNGRLSGLVRQALFPGSCRRAKMVKKPIFEDEFVQVDERGRIIRRRRDGSEIGPQAIKDKDEDEANEFDDYDDDEEEGLLLKNATDGGEEEVNEEEEELLSDGYGSADVTIDDDYYFENVKYREFGKIEAIVPKEDLSKAIGANGLNVKLAASVCRCFIEIFTEDGDDSGYRSDGFGEERRDGGNFGGFNSYDNDRRRDFNRNAADDSDNRWSEDLSWNRDNYDYDDETSADYNDSSSFYDDLIGSLEDESWRDVPPGKPMNLTEDDISMEVNALNEQIRKNREEGDGGENHSSDSASTKEAEDKDGIFAKMEALEFDDEEGEFFDEEDEDGGNFNDMDDEEDDDFYDDLWDDEDDDERESDLDLK